MENKIQIKQSYTPTNWMMQKKQISRRNVSVPRNTQSSKAETLVNGNSEQTITRKQIESVIRKLQTNKSQDQKAPLVNTNTQ